MLSMLARYGEETWFQLGDIDLATHVLRTHMLHTGHSLTEVTDHMRSSLNVQHAILPMSNDPVATLVDTEESGEIAFQTYFVRHRWQPVVRAIRYQGADSAAVTEPVRSAIARADAIIIGPSNPWLSIAPILSVGDMRDVIRSRNVPCVAVSPIVGGKAIKGPTAKLMQELNIPSAPDQVAAFYGDVINGFVYDRVDDMPAMKMIKTIALQTVMRTDHDKIELADTLLRWIQSETWR
jgi:LPPG:FO 2-phospho-L-lactate transferase